MRIGRLARRRLRLWPTRAAVDAAVEGRSSSASPERGMVSARAVDSDALDDALPVDELRRVVALRTGISDYPDEHAVEVAVCAGRIADQLGLGLRVRRAVVEGALLHDVGKLFVDASILAKSGPLTPEEREEVKRHPVEGGRLLRDEVEPSVIDVVRAHHERWDGGGYPRGLSAERIPLAARIVAVADAYLAMREKRPYRDALTEEAALDELRTHSGSQFDPECVAALLTAIAFSAGAMRSSSVRAVTT
jgi:putative nucleotidyltransferase with HDIG domain